MKNLEHEPCALRGECYHARAGRKSFELHGSPATPEGRAKGGHRSFAIHGSPATTEGRVKGGYKSFELHGSPATPEGRAKGGRIGGRNGGNRRFELHGSPATQEGRAKGARNGGRKTARTLSHKRPTWPEAHFYGLVFADGLSKGFTAQQDDGYGIYDGAWLRQRIVVELDGGGHHAFRDRHEEDALKDAARRADRFIVLRETDENVLFLKALALLQEI